MRHTVRERANTCSKESKDERCAAKNTEGTILFVKDGILLRTCGASPLQPRVLRASVEYQML
jgi:hypothetical protein